VAALVAKAVPSINALLAAEGPAERQAGLSLVAAVLATIPTSLRPQLASLEPTLVKVWAVGCGLAHDVVLASVEDAWWLHADCKPRPAAGCSLPVWMVAAGCEALHYWR
jgi:hypothetical protein